MLKYIFTFDDFYYVLDTENNSIKMFEKSIFFNENTLNVDIKGRTFKNNGINLVRQCDETIVFNDNSIITMLKPYYLDCYFNRYRNIHYLSTKTGIIYAIHREVDERRFDIDLINENIDQFIMEHSDDTTSGFYTWLTSVKILSSITKTNCDYIIDMINDDLNDLKIILGHDLYNFFNFFDTETKLDCFDLSKLNVGDKVVCMAKMFEHLTAKRLIMPRFSLHTLCNMREICGEFLNVDILDFSNCFDDISNSFFQIKDFKRSYPFHLTNKDGLYFLVIPNGATNFKKALIQDNNLLMDKYNTKYICMKLSELKDLEQEYAKYVLLGKKGIYIIETDLR